VPALSRWLGRSRRVAFPYTDTDSAACALFGIDAAQTPSAALGYLADFSEPPPATCFRLDPVHLRADTSGLVLFSAHSAGITEQESLALFNAIRPWLEKDGWAMRRGAVDRWYVHTPETAVPVPVTRPLAEVAGQPVSACLPTGGGAGIWLRRINEMQMLLHGQPVNQQRAARGRPLINGLWLWGGGAMPEPGTSAYSQIFTARCVLSGLADLHGVPQAGQVAAAALLPNGPGSLLVDLDVCELAATRADVQGWCDAAGGLERDWFSPLLASLARGAIQRLELFPLDGFRYPLRRRDLLALWRRRRPSCRIPAF